MSSNELTVRPLAESEMPRFREIDSIAFLEKPQSAELAEWVGSILETDRSIGLFDGDTHVGNASIFTLDVTVPGGIAVPMAGVTWVGVLPTHRRRGGLTKLMRHQLETLHETGGEALAGLTASQDGIYGRFGYGVATYSAALDIPRGANKLRLPADAAEVTVRLVEPASVQTVCDEIYARCALRRPGMLGRPKLWSDLMIAEFPEFREGKSVLRCLLAEREGVPVGYARYRSAGVGEERHVQVEEVHGDDAAANGALWQVLLNIDLSAHTVVEGLPVDDPLLLMLEATRVSFQAPRDGMHVRLVDLDRALAARTYSTPIDVVLEVDDAFCPWNAGRWRLSADEKGATCSRTDAPADVSIDVRELGSAYLGGRTLIALASAGLATEHRSGALTALSRAFAGDLQPWLAFGV
jgi:predicted acetyltransferase